MWCATRWPTSRSRVRRLQPRTFTLEEVFLGAGRTGGQAQEIVVDTEDPEAVQRAALAAPARGRPQRRGATGAARERRAPTPWPSARILDRGYRRYHGRRRGVRGRGADGRAAQHPAGARAAPHAPGPRSCRSASCCSPTCRPSSSSARLAAPRDHDRRRAVDPGRHPAHLRRVPRLRQPARRPAGGLRRARDPLHRPPHGHARPVPGLAAHPRHLPRRQGARVGRGAHAGHDRAHRCSCSWPSSSRARAPTAVERAAHRRCASSAAASSSPPSTPALSMGVSSLTDRKAFATAGLILLFFLSNVVTGVLIEGPGLDREPASCSTSSPSRSRSCSAIHGEAEHFQEVGARRRRPSRRSGGPSCGPRCAGSATSTSP